jgi:hypothetical protein
MNALLLIVIFFAFALASMGILLIAMFVAHALSQMKVEDEQIEEDKIDWGMTRNIQIKPRPKTPRPEGPKPCV